MVKEFNKADSVNIAAPAHMSIYNNPNSIYQKLCLCDYLRELPENPVGYSDDSDPQVPPRELPVAH
jgi:hypothetical protein